MLVVRSRQNETGFSMHGKAGQEMLEDTYCMFQGFLQEHVVFHSVKAVLHNYVVPTKAAGDLQHAGWTRVEQSSLFASRDYTALLGPAKWEPCRLMQMEVLRLGIVGSNRGSRDTVQDGLSGLWMDGKMTVQAMVGQELCPHETYG